MYYIRIKYNNIFIVIIIYLSTKMTMDNFQLYRTNPLLSGQVKWDLILNAAGENLVISDFKLSPISDNITYSKYNDDDLLKYDHPNNVKKLYKNLGDSFFSLCVDDSLISSAPIISDTYINSHVGDYEMGCRRNKTYQIQKKQYYFLCPIWLEKLAENQTLSIKISAYINDHMINSKSVVFKTKYATSKEEEYHNKFISYFKKYIKDSGIESGNDNVINVDNNSEEVKLTGIDVKSGLFDKYIILPDTYEHLVYRERTVIENDDILINTFRDNCIITNQLLNFSLYFNPEDIIPVNFLDEILGKFITYKCEVSIGTPVIKEGEIEVIYNYLEMKDFYSNYEYIPRAFCGNINKTHEGDVPNVLDYNYDYRNVNLITKNKMIQPIVHWSLCDNNDYIFNLYPGYKGFTIVDSNIVSVNNSLYADTPDLNNEKYSATLNNIGWCNWVQTDNADFGDFGNMDYYKSLCTNFKSNWIHNVKYDKYLTKLKLKELYPDQTNEYINDRIDYNIKVLLMYNPSLDLNVYKSKLNRFNNDMSKMVALYEYDSGNGVLQFVLYNTTGMWNNIIGDYENTMKTEVGITDNYYLFICSNNEDLLTFKSFYNLLNDQDVNTNIIEMLKNDIDKEFDIAMGITKKDDTKVKQIYPSNKLYRRYLLDVLNILYSNMYSVATNEVPRITLKNSIYPSILNCNLLNSKEIIHRKMDGTPVKLYRYCGKIKPTFVKTGNYLYCKKYISDEVEYDEFGNSLGTPWSRSIYAKLNSDLYDYTFPSIGYYALHAIGEWDYENIPKNNNNIPIIVDPEYHWFNNGKIGTLKEDISCELESELDENNEYVKVKDLVKRYIGNLYGIGGDLLDYVFSLYEYESDFDYKDIKDIKNYIYRVKITLI